MSEENESHTAPGQRYCSWLSTGETDTINDVIRRAAERWPDRIFLDFSGETWTYQQVYQRALAYAAGLADAGVQRGDTVATVLDNHIDAVTLWFGINFLGAISVPVNTANRGEFLRHQIDDSAAKIVVAESDYAERVLDIADGISNLATLLYRGDLPDRTKPDIKLAPVTDIRRDGTDFTPHTVRPEDLAILIYTSGTTGPAKGCMSSHNYYCNVARRSNVMFERTANTVVWSPMPLFHLMATAVVVLATAQVGARAALLQHFSLTNFWSEIERTGATEANLIGAMAPLVATMPDSPEMQRCRGQLRVMGANPVTTGNRHGFLPGQRPDVAADELFRAFELGQTSRGGAPRAVHLAVHLTCAVRGCSRTGRHRAAVRPCRPPRRGAGGTAMRKTRRR